MKLGISEFVVLRERRMHFRVWGDAAAPKLFLLHGWGDVSASFQFVVDALRRDWRVIAPDWRGFGWSQWNGDAYWFPDYIADLDAALEHYSPDAPVRLVGHSMGGNVATLYAGIRPGRVAGIVNLEGFGLKPTAPADAPERFDKWLEQLRSAPGFRSYPDRAAFAARLRYDNPRLTPARAEFLAGHLAEDADGGVRIAADPCHRWVNPVLYRIEEMRACWRRVTAPMLWVRGADSAFMREYIAGEDDFRARLACFADAREVTLNECGHNLHHDRPEDVARLIEEFFT
ncbi:MAG: alpha/beta hydrolase [Rhodocyclaceae bacterium]|nr:alpha/beta hydrolase [Rhodocyclaceae bacterium]